MAAIAAAALCGSTPDLGVFGVWRTPGSDGSVEISSCGSTICARLLSSEEIREDPEVTDQNNVAPGLRGRRLKNLSLFEGFRGSGPEWSGGRIYDPESGRSYKSHLMLLSPTKLRVTGHFGPFAKTQIWNRAP